MLEIKPNMHFGKLTVIRQLEERLNRQIGWLCRCSCGKKTKVRSQTLRNGRTQSCGCMVGKSHNPEITARKKALATKRSWMNEDTRTRRICGISQAKKRHLVSEDTKEKISTALIGHKQSRALVNRRAKTYRENYAAGLHAPRPLTRKPHTPEVIAKIADANRGKTRTPSQRRRMADAVSNLWSNTEYREKVLEGRSLSPNKLEQSVFLKLRPLGFRFTGDGKFWVHRKDESHCPDFKLNNKKILVEIWGDYWHRGQKPRALEKWYEKSGFMCLVLWEHEVKSGDVYKIVKGWLDANM